MKTLEINLVALHYRAWPAEVEMQWRERDVWMTVSRNGKACSQSLSITALRSFRSTQVLLEIELDRLLTHANQEFPGFTTPSRPEGMPLHRYETLLERWREVQSNRKDLTESRNASMILRG